MGKIKTAIGLMSGTSLDGIDAALLETDGQARVNVLARLSCPYSAQFRRALQQGLQQAKDITSAEQRPGGLARLERELTERHTEAVAALLRDSGHKAAAIDIIGFHGQTVLHRPPEGQAAGLTVQLGDGALLARQTGIAVMADMRSADMRMGGNGAPLIPVYHAACAAELRDKRAFPVAFVNIGGIANCTYIAKAEADLAADVAAFDCGPGNALLDQWAEAETGRFFDDGGQAGLRGRALPWLTQAYLALPVFHRQRRSFDRLDFPPLSEFLQKFPGKTVSYEDGAASLAFITAQGIIGALRQLPQQPKTLLVSGGGVHNAAIMAELGRYAVAQGASLLPAEQEGLSSGFMEAEAWAYLAVRALYELPLTYPATTGCRAAVSGGVYHPAPKRA